MEYTNNGQLARPLYYALTHSTYERAEDCYSVTALIDSPRIRILSNRHESEIVKDASSGIFAMLGTAFHVALEAYPHGISEKRFYADITPDVRIAGIPDLVDDGTLYDYKTTSVWTHVYDGVKPSWIKQMNAYRWLLRRNDIIVNELLLVAIFRDWSASSAAQKPELPQYPSLTYTVPMWSLDETYEYLTERADSHHSAEQLKDELLPECTPEERWQKDSVYAVYQGKQKRASRLLSTESEANGWIAAQSDTGYRIELRPEVWNRCEKYCDAKEFCNQYKEKVDGTGTSIDDDGW